MVVPNAGSIIVVPAGPGSGGSGLGLVTRSATVSYVANAGPPLATAIPAAAIAAFVVYNAAPNFKGDAASDRLV